LSAPKRILRDMNKTLVSIFSSLLLVPVLADEKPNIIYILADDLGYGDVQHLNPERGKILTPHMDQMAKEGMTFTDAHTTSSVCTPTRYSILTGRYNWRTKLQRSVLNGYGKSLIEKKVLTVPTFLRDNGYTTAMIGKWHLGLGLPTIDKQPAKPADNAELKNRKNKGAFDPAEISNINWKGRWTGLRRL